MRAWRTVSINESAVGPRARRNERSIWARCSSVAASAPGLEATSKRLGMTEALNTDSGARVDGAVDVERDDERRGGAGVAAM